MDICRSFLFYFIFKHFLRRICRQKKFQIPQQSEHRPFKIQLTLEQHGFELHGSTYTQIFFSIGRVGLSYLLVSDPQSQLIMNQTQYFHIPNWFLNCG